MELIGNCKFCGQEIAVMASAEEEADLLASKECNCPGAVTDRRIKRGLEDVELFINGIPSRTHIVITHCPNCGRKLEGVE